MSTDPAEGSTFVGSQSMSTGDGGGGMTTCNASPSSFDDAVVWYVAVRGAPVERTPAKARWRTEENRPGWRSVDYVEVHAVGHCAAPGFRPDLVPPEARSIIVTGHVSGPQPVAGASPGSGPPPPDARRRRRWWRRR